MLLTCCLHTCSHCEFGEDSNDVACDGPDDLDEGGFVFVFQHGGYYYWHIQTDFQVSSVLLDAVSPFVHQNLVLTSNIFVAVVLLADYTLCFC